MSINTTQDYAQEVATAAHTLIATHRAHDSDTYLTTLESLTASQAQDVITAILVATHPRYQ